MENEYLNSIVLDVETRSSLSPTKSFPRIRVNYPSVLKNALEILFDEYNEVFSDLVHSNIEWEKDYQYCFINGAPVNYIAQIDMCGISNYELSLVNDFDIDTAVSFLRNRIFEIENSWALYQILGSVCSTAERTSFYGKQTRRMLDEIRARFKRPIALLALTQEKHESVKACEFGKGPNEMLTQKEVFELSGFDNLFGPNDFLDYLNGSSYSCEYLLFVRASDPIEKLRKPETIVAQPLTSISKIRKIIKENSITLNVDNPDWGQFDSRRLNDTKRYLSDMQMGFSVFSYEDIQADSFDAYLNRKGSSVEQVMSTSTKIRAKPLQGTFGCYGHIRGFLSDKDFRHNLKRNIRKRGPYVLQLEQTPPVVTNTFNDVEYAFIDRVFVGKIRGRTEWFGGHREFLPCSSNEVKSGRLHGNAQAVTAEIL